MGFFSVSSRGLDTIELEADNWIVALGQGLAVYGSVADVERLACENLGNGTVIVRDIKSGVGYIVSESAEPVVEPEPPAKNEMRMAIDAIRESKSIEEACQLALGLAQDFVPGESGSVLLKQGDFLVFVAVSGPKAEQLAGARIPLDQGVAGVCLQQGRALVLGRAENDPRHFSAVDAHTGYNTKQICSVPIIHDGQAHGVLQVLNLPKGENFGRVYLESLAAVGDLLGTRIHAEEKKKKK